MRTVRPESGRRDRVADLMAEGLDNRSIAERLNMTPAQVTGYIAGIRKRLGWQAS